MKFRLSLTIRFILIVSPILLAVLGGIYLYANYYLTDHFYQRLRNHASTTGEFLLVVDEVDSTLLRKLSDRNRNALTEESISVFDKKGTPIFSTTGIDRIPLEARLLNQIQVEKELRFKYKNYHAIGLYFEHGAEPHFIIGSAIDDYAQEFLAGLRIIMSVLFLIVITWVSLAGWYYSGKAIAPIGTIEHKLTSIVPQNMHLRLERSKNDDEIDKLSHTINQLLDRVEETFMLQRMFVSNVSHELRNPLTKMSSQLEVSLLKPRSTDEYQKTIYSVLDDIQELIALTQNLLKLTQVDNSKKELLVEVVRIDELLWECRTVIVKSNALYQVEMALDDLPEDPDNLCVLGNYALLKTAVSNLIENSCKFSYDKKATIRLSYTNNTIEIHVEDKGVGIRSAELSYIFQPFYRSSQTSEVKGYGIGLSLVERIARMHSGRVEVTSVPEVSTLFSLILPSYANSN